LDTVPRRRLKFRRRRYLLYLSPLTYKRFRDYLQGLRHQPVNGLFNFTKLKKPYNFILFILFYARTLPPACLGLKPYSSFRTFKPHPKKCGRL
jgi:hypothetical protein